MKLTSILLGIATIALLIGMLVITRIMVVKPDEKEFVLQEVEAVSLPEPPLPPESEPLDDIPPPPPPALADLTPSLDLDTPALPVSDMRIDPKLAVDPFFTDTPPSPLPQPVVRKPKVNPTPRSVPSSNKPVRPKPTPPKPKSQYSLSELDRKPRLIRNPSVRFPSSIKNATSGRVVVRVAILPSGRSRFISVVSSTHPALIPAAKRVANGSRFSTPTRHGKAVKAIMTWPIIIKK